VSLADILGEYQAKYHNVSGVSKQLRAAEELIALLKAGKTKDIFDHNLCMLY
jgi:hypothetical protein